MDEQAASTTEKIDFTKYFENTVNSFLDPNLLYQKQEFENQIDEWGSNLVYIPNLLECIQKTKLPNSLFFSSLCIKFLLEKFNVEISMSDIQDIFSGIAHRLYNLYGEYNKNNDKNEEEEEDEKEELKEEEKENIILEFQKCRINLLKCISLIQVNFPDFIEKWNVFSPDDSKILLGFLFEEEGKQLPDAHNIFMKKISIISKDHIKKVLQNSIMSSEWLHLFKYSLQKATEIGEYSEFWERLNSIPEYQNLYPDYIEVFLECIENEYFFLSKKSADFMERIFDVIFEMIDNLISQPTVENIQMASFLWKEIVGYDNEFLYDRYKSFRLNERNKKEEKSKLIDFFIESLKVIIQFDDEFFDLCESVSEPFGLLIELESNKPIIESKNITPAILEFLSFLVDTINMDPLKYMTIELRSCFEKVSKYSENKLINSFYNRILQPEEHEGTMMVSPGAIFAISSSSEYFMIEYSMKLADIILTNPSILPPNIILFFISQCCNYFGQRIHNMIEYAFNSIGSGFDEEATNSISNLCKYYPQIVIDTPEYLDTICEYEINSKIDDASSIIYSTQALLYIMNYAKSGHQAYIQSEEAIINGIIGKVRIFYENYECCRLVLVLINCYADMVKLILPDIQDNPILCEFLVKLCSQIIDKINLTNVIYGFEEGEDEGEKDDEENKPMKLHSLIQENLCSFVSVLLDTNMIENRDHIIDWLGVSLSKNPVPDHIEILEKISDLFPTDSTRDFILNVGNSDDNEMMIAVLKFVKYLAVEKWEPFFETFPQSYFLEPLESPDTRILDITLETVSAIIDMEIETKTIFFENEHYDIASKITDGVFTNFEDIGIRKSINIWIKLFETGFVETGNLIEFVLTKIPEKCAEYHSFCEALSPGEFGFDREQILRTVYGLKTSLAVTS